MKTNEKRHFALAAWRNWRRQRKHRGGNNQAKIGGRRRRWRRNVGGSVIGSGARTAAARRPGVGIGICAQHAAHGGAAASKAKAKQ